jgi:hypothetical protein
MNAITQQHKKAIPAVLKCKTCESPENALQTAASAIAFALGADSLQSHRMIQELQSEELIRMHIQTAREAQRVRWRLTDSARAQLKSETRAWFESQLQADGRSQISMLRVELPQLTDLQLARFASGDTSIRDQMRGYIRRNLPGPKAPGQSR